MNIVESVDNALKSSRIQIVLVTQAAFEHSYRFCLHEEDVLIKAEVFVFRNCKVVFLFR